MTYTDLFFFYKKDFAITIFFKTSLFLFNDLERERCDQYFGYVKDNKQCK